MFTPYIEDRYGLEDYVDDDEEPEMPKEFECAYENQTGTDLCKHVWSYIHGLCSDNKSFFCTRCGIVWVLDPNWTPPVDDKYAKHITQVMYRVQHQISNTKEVME